ncbi:hypothetical protein POPTR_006G014066v4 [Populus trichocarpa]|uniref:non-specific serine/threonine protein kinase n=2 Tax=Populus trichocarpa TaxID=3694 RepID=A0A3N7F4H9_POPTR|nr:probable LRR receptor-like serine/threonine-protein kinase At1g53430 isoform X1 [Populus trichocarpa]RQO91152.1 hypothetical protein POPTR_006G014066v4 [Populus trichocarpa]|eukprot:XP_024459116.1 probable LRR receptor-like serine/threonine-protein kinase At1g53430 isoform X1 [Populus trichocarpa]
MDSELSVVLVIRLLFFNFLLLWQLGNGAKVNNGTTNIKANGDNTTIGALTDAEARTLRLLFKSLQSRNTTQFPLSYPICSTNMDAEIRCSCDNTKNRSACWVTAINLASKMLDGLIHSSISLFKNLRVLDLSSNFLTGSIPPSLTTLQSLRILNLADNNLDGTIPLNLSGLQSLRYLDLSRNKLTGPIPDSISDCQYLNIIILRLNFLNGTIPEALGTLSSLNILDLYSNSLSGHIPVELGELTVLQFLNLDDNNLDGELPEELGNLVDLQHLYLTANKFTGRIPETFDKLIHLETFAVGGNYLSGQMPSYIGNWVNLTKLILIGNNFEGNLPAETFSLPKLQRLLVSDVSNPGISFPKREVIPESLIYLVLRNCKINGSIPEYIGKWPELSYLDLSFNNLSGGVPESFQKLNKLFLTSNELTKLPSWITKKPKPSSYPKADLSYNNFNVKCTNEKCSGLAAVNILPTRSFIDNMKTEKCYRKHNSLFINCGGEELNVGKDHYHNDTSTSSFNLSPSDDWAYSFSGDYLWATVNASTLVRNSTCKDCTPETKIDNDFRLAPVSLMYYGLCLHKGKYIVTLHFSETLYSKGEDHSITGKRVFDVYIQGRLVKKDLNIKEIPELQNEVRKLKFPAKINEGSLEIKLFWAGKGSLYNPPGINGPLIEAISVTRVSRKLHRWEIALITIGCLLFLMLLLAFSLRMGWIGGRKLRSGH